MTYLNTPDYYRQRERQERALAGAATSAAIRAIHLELANRYADIIQDAEAPAARRHIRLVSA
jgi:hypothetical protein